MKRIIAALIITSGLVFLGLSQRYDFNDERYRIDKLTGEVEHCVWGTDLSGRVIPNTTNECEVVFKGTGIFKMLSSGDSE